MSRESKRRFQFIREIASGGFGGVYLCKVMHADGFSRLAAVKLLHRRWSENEEIARRMRDEARLLGWLRHRNIVDVVDLTSIDGRAAVVMEYLEACDLKNMVAFLGETGELVPPRVVMEIMANVSSALDAAYNRPPYPGEKPLRVIHRDIKPSNVMIDESGLVKVLDFGVARADFDSRESHTRELQFGSVDYMPPERLFFEPETPASDIYSLGASIFEVLTLEKLGKAKGRPERHARFLADRMSFMRASLIVPPQIGSEIEQLLTRCLAFEHQDRPSAEEVQKIARGLSRSLATPNINEWCEDKLPDLVRRAQALQSQSPPNPMAGRVLEEDSQVFVRSEGTQKLAPQPAFEEVRPPAAELGPNPTIVPDMDDLPPMAGGNQSFDSLLDQSSEDEWAADAATRIESTPKPAASPPEPRLPHQDVDPTVVNREPPPPPPADLAPPMPPPPPTGLDAAPSPPPPPTLPSLEPSMDDWDDVPTRIESLAAMEAKEEPKPAPQPFGGAPAAPLGAAPPPPELDHDAATQVFGSDDEELESTMVRDGINPGAATEVGVQAEDGELEDPYSDEAATRILGKAPPPPPTLGPPGAPPPAAAPTPPAPPAQPPAPPAQPLAQKGPPPAAVVEEDASERSMGPTPPPPPAEEPKKKSKLPMLAGIGCGVLLALAVCGGGGSYVALNYLGEGGNTLPVDIPTELPEQPDVPAEPSEPAEPATPAEPAAPAGGMSFTSLDPETKKLTVTCTGEKAKGATTATVSLESDDKCLVVAIMNDRSRRQVSVENPTQGEYQCFAPGGKDECVR